MHFDPRIGNMSIEDDIFIVRFKEDLVLDIDVAKAMLEIREEMSCGRKYPIFFDCRTVRYWTKQARDLHASERNNRYLIAAGCLYTESVFATILINFYLKFSPPNVPLRFFTTEADALEWLKQLT